MNINLVDGLRHLYLNGINSITNQKNNGLRSWLYNGNGLLLNQLLQMSLNFIYMIKMIY